MSRVLVVTGTDTGVGKTVTTAAVAALAVAAGRRVAVVKPVQTGTQDGDDDAAEVARLAGTGAGSLSTALLAAYPEPLAPTTAARRSGLPPLRLDAAVLAVERAAAEHDLVLVEGAGGLLVHLADSPPWTLVDLAAALAAPVLVVARPGLGTLNHTALTAHALRSRRLEPAGVVIGSWPREPVLAERCNVDELGGLGAGPLVGALPAGLGAPGTEPAAFLAGARPGLAPVLGGTFDAAHFVRAEAPRPAPPTDAPEPKATE